MQRSYERRRWLRDGGRGGAGLSRRGACCCGVRIVNFFVLFFWAPRAGKESSRRAAAFFSFAAPRPSRGRKHASSPSHCAATPRRKQRRDARTRVFCDGLAAWRPMPGGFFFSLSFLLRRRRPADERSRARQTRTSGVPVPTWPIICAALRAISSRSQNRGKTLRFRARVAWNGKSSGAMGRCRQAPS